MGFEIDHCIPLLHHNNSLALLRNDVSLFSVSVLKVLSLITLSGHGTIPKLMPF